jgi:hypothetical protein
MIPGIKDISYLTGHDLFIRFTDGDERICDMSQFFSPQFSKQYYPISEFKKFTYTEDHIAWGDDDYTIGYDSLYNVSFPYSDLISVLSIQSISLGRIAMAGDSDPYPISLWAHDEMTCSHNDPHIHVVYGRPSSSNKGIPFSFDGKCLIDKNPFNSKVNKFIRIMLKVNFLKSIQEWNKNNPSMIVDEATGRVKQP